MTWRSRFKVLEEVRRYTYGVHAQLIMAETGLSSGAVYSTLLWLETHGYVRSFVNPEDRSGRTRYQANYVDQVDA